MTKPEFYIYGAEESSKQQIFYAIGYAKKNIELSEVNKLYFCDENKVICKPNGKHDTLFQIPFGTDSCLKVSHEN